MTQIELVDSTDFSFFEQQTHEKWEREEIKIDNEIDYYIGFEWFQRFDSIQLEVWKTISNANSTTDLIE